MLSVGIFTYSTKPRGSVVHAAALAEALCDRGHRATPSALSKPGEGFYRPLRCPLHLFPAEAANREMDQLVKQRIAEFVRGLRELAARHDVYHAEDCLAANALLGAASFGVGPVVRTVHHVEHFESPYLAECQRRSIERAALLFSVSSFTQSEVQREFSRHALLTRNAVDRTRFLGTPEPSANELERRFGIRAGDRIVLSVGGVEPRKNSLAQLGAVTRVLATEPRVRWLIAGGASIFDHSSYRAEFEAQLSLLPAELRSRIVCTGQLSEDELTWLYQRSDALLCASLLEGFGLCVLEALAAEAPVIVSQERPFTEYLSEQSACFVDPHSVESIAAGLARVLTDRPFAAHLRANGLALSAGFSWDSAANDHVSHYQALLRRREPEQLPCAVG